LKVGVNLVYLTKADGSRQLFDRDKVAKTCMRMGASPQVAYFVAQKVEQRLYDGIPSREILKMIFVFLRKHKPGLKHLYDLRKGISLMSPKPEFEVFVQVLLAQNGYEVTSNQILQGKCVGHEVDALARKDGLTYFVEAKHHFNYHALTGLDESRIARAVLEDVTEGFMLGKTKLKIDRAIIVTNTKFSEQARLYGVCRGIIQIGWSIPQNHGLQDLIEAQKMYPLSCLKGLKNDVRLSLVNYGIVLIKHLAQANPQKIAQNTFLSIGEASYLIQKAKLSMDHQ
jgi:hypothetical protein